VISDALRPDTIGSGPGGREEIATVVVGEDSEEFVSGGTEERHGARSQRDAGFFGSQDSLDDRT
jgi:hypothetical protein